MEGSEEGSRGLDTMVRMYVEEVDRGMRGSMYVRVHHYFGVLSHEDDVGGIFEAKRAEEES
jgi:hypothetical protein